MVVGVRVPPPAAAGPFTRLLGGHPALRHAHSRGARRAGAAVSRKRWSAFPVRGERPGGASALRPDRVRMPRPGGREAVAHLPRGDEEDSVPKASTRRLSCTERAVFPWKTHTNRLHAALSAAQAPGSIGCERQRTHETLHAIRAAEGGDPVPFPVGDGLPAVKQPALEPFRPDRGDGARRGGGEGPGLPLGVLASVQPYTAEHAGQFMGRAHSPGCRHQGRDRGLTTSPWRSDGSWATPAGEGASPRLWPDSKRGRRHLP